MKRQANHTVSFIRGCVLLLIFLLLIVNTNQSVLAEGTDPVSFVVELQNNDISTQDNDIQFSPVVGEKYVFKATIKNISDLPVSISVFPSVASTKNGAINYVKVADELSNQDYDLTKYVDISPVNSATAMKDGRLNLKKNESVDIQIAIQVTKELDGEILGGISFSQIIGKQESKNSASIVQVYQKVIGVRLKMKELTVKKAQTYDGFTFENTSEAIQLNYSIHNNNPIVSPVDDGTYQLLNPEDKEIAKGKLEKGNIILAPYSKTEMNAPLLDGSELISGEYQFIVHVNGKDIVNKFNYSKEEIKKIAEKSEKTSTVMVNSGNNTWLILLLTCVVIILILIIAKSYILKKS
ncbi:DUF916 domain-containing protein [Erwinia sp. CPCC 100877]|nr:DUF916 domain-containing protein [Erwinia sp. CPCC 100877]